MTTTRGPRAKISEQDRNFGTRMMSDDENICHYLPKSNKFTP